MDITFTWSWLAFWLGVGATLTVQFWLAVIIAIKQYRKTAKAKKAMGDSLEDALKSWSSPK